LKRNHGFHIQHVLGLKLKYSGNLIIDSNSEITVRGPGKGCPMTLVKVKDIIFKTFFLEEQSESPCELNCIGRFSSSFQEGILHKNISSRLKERYFLLDAYSRLKFMPRHDSFSTHGWMAHHVSYIRLKSQWN